MTYRTRIVGNSLTLLPTPGAGASVTVAGTAADGTALRADGNSLSGLTAGENTIAIKVQAEDGASGSYTLAVEAIPTSATTLAALELEGSELSPAFGPGRTTYRTRIVGNALAVTATPTDGAVAISGTAADGTALRADSNSISGLTVGENMIAIEVQAQDGTRGSYTLVVEASGDIRGLPRAMRSCAKTTATRTSDATEP